MDTATRKALLEKLSKEAEEKGGEFYDDSSYAGFESNTGPKKNRSIRNDSEHEWSNLHNINIKVSVIIIIIMEEIHKRNVSISSINSKSKSRCILDVQNSKMYKKS